MQCLSKHKWRGRRQAPSDTHNSREETEEKDERQKTKTKKDPSTTRCAQINTARPRTQTLWHYPPANQDATSSRREKKNGRERKREKTRKGRKTHKPRKLNSMAGTPDHDASTKTKYWSRCDRSAEQLFTCGFVQAVVDRLLQQAQLR